MPIKADVCIVGAGLLGSSVANHLSRLGVNSVSVVDIDLEGVYSSSELNAGGVRATWNHPVNAEISKISIDYFSRVKDQIGFRQNGYFWMFSKEDWPKASKKLKDNEKLKDLKIEYLTPSEITQRHPFIDKTQDLGGATFSPNDGLINPNLLKSHYRSEAKNRGVSFLDRYWVHSVSILNSNSKNKKIELKAWHWNQNVSHDEIKKILVTNNEAEIEESTHPIESVTIECDYLVNCSGAWAKRFAKLMGTECPSQPLRRQVSIFECKGVDLSDYGMFVDSSGVYFHAEGGNILGGYATPDEPPGFNFEYDGAGFFEQYLWPSLYERSSKFENLKHITGWAGLYEISPDHSPIVGSVPGFSNVFEAHSFSGRGAMQSYGAGLGLSELIAKKRFETIDLSALNCGRFASGALVSEGLLI